MSSQGGGGRRFGHFGYGRGGGSKPQSQQNLVCQDPPNLIFHDPPIRDESCRICNTLEAHGDTKQLYDNHVSNYPTGCPRYVGMSVNRRYQLALEAKLCLACHHPDYIHKKSDKDHKCSVVSSKRKGRFTCQSSGCFLHLWVCTRHKSTNMPHLEKFRDEVKAKYDLDFGFVVSIPVLASSLKQVETGKSKVKVPAKKSNPANSNKQEVEVIEVNNTAKPTESAASCNHPSKSLSTDQALSKLKKKLMQGGIKDKLQPIAKGRPQFMIGYSKGKTRGLMTLYDTGCGGVLFRAGVPENELEGSVLKTKGPFIVKGVGDTSVTVNDEFLCTMSLVDSRRQIMEGWTMNKITANLPKINLGLAEAELKASNKNNSALQNLR